jgi:DNA-binding XRE family transcriptional regulator
MTVQYIEKNGRREYAIVPIDEYERLVAAAEMADDILTYDNVKSKIREGDDEAVPSQVVNRLLDGENPIRVWREFRGLTQQQLAEHVGITESYLQQLESGTQEIRIQTLSDIAQALRVMVDDIACWQNE